MGLHVTISVKLSAQVLFADSSKYFDCVEWVGGYLTVFNLNVANVLKHVKSTSRFRDIREDWRV